MAKIGMLLMILSAIAGLLCWPLKINELLLFSLLGFPVGNFLYNRGKRKHAKNMPPINFEKHDIVLYLRPFKEDIRAKRSLSSYYLVGPFIFWLLPFGIRTPEQKMAKKVKPYGILASIGDPNINLPFLGARRQVLKDDDWKNYIHFATKKSKIIILRVGKQFSEGFQWECEQVLGALDKSKVLILMPNWPETYYKMVFLLKKKSNIEVPEWNSKWNSSDFYSIIYFGKDSTPYFFYPRGSFFTIDDNAKAVGDCLRIRGILHEHEITLKSN